MTPDYAGVELELVLDVGSGSQDCVLSGIFSMFSRTP